MVKLDKIYTRGGDLGVTSLGDGARVNKYDLRVMAYGAVDEANAAIGLARLHTVGELDAILERIQNDLFDLGADLCVPATTREKSRFRVSKGQVTRLEKEIDHLNERLQPLSSFVLPGGSAAAAHLHMARTIVRRAERVICELLAKEGLDNQGLAYINRLSDLMFVAARYLNNLGNEDVLWKPGENQ